MNNFSACERAYKECFSEVSENNGIVVFTDQSLPDMYDHNFFFATMDADQNNLINTLNHKFMETQDTGFCHLVFDSDYQEATVKEIADKTHKKMKLSKYGQYLLDLTKLNEWKERKDCDIRIFESDNQIKDIIELDIKMDAETVGEDFCIRRAKRKGKVFVTNINLMRCLLYYEKELVASCDAFTNNGTAKIEDFYVLPKFQKMGFGTTLLKNAVRRVTNEGIEIIYLDTDEEDTAKDMYRKLGFSKVGEYYKLFWADWMQ